MPNMKFETSNTYWGLTASISKQNFIFSGTFEKTRINSERLNEFLRKTGTVCLWLIMFIGFFTAVLQFYPFTAVPDIHKLLIPSGYNLGLWLGILCILLQWAKFKEAEINETTVNILELSKTDTQTEAIDIYSLFNKEARHAWDTSFTIAESYQNKHVSGSHILLALLQTDSVKEAFWRLNINPNDIEIFLRNFEVLGTEKKDFEEIKKIPFAALAQSLTLHNPCIDPLMLLCALKEQLPNNHIVQDIFFNIDISLEDLQILAGWIFHIRMLAKEFALLKKLSHYKTDSEINVGLTSLPTPNLDRFSRDLTMAAKYSRLPLSLGRAQDVNELFIQAGQTGGSAVITGKPGTGRTTLIHELAYKMASEQVPSFWQDKRLVLIELSSLVSGKLPAEQILTNCLTDAVRAGNIVLVMEDIHILADTKTTTGVNLLILLIDFLSQHKLQVLGTSSIEDCAQTLLTTPNFNQIFSIYELQPLSRSGALLAGCIKASLLESRGNCLFSYGAITTAYDLSNIYIHTSNQPEKTIHLLVQAAGNGENKKRKLITEETIRSVISKITHIPTETFNQNEAEKLLNLEQELGKAVVGQKNAIIAISESLRRARSGLNSGSRPLSSFLFLGPTGVGKTELSKTLASVYFGKEEYLLRLDMSEFTGPDSLIKLLGSPNSKTDSPLVSHIKTYPFCLLLCDEFEKAGKEVHNIFLQILDEGRLTSGKGETLDLTHCMIIATSNAGTAYIQKSLEKGTTMQTITTELVDAELLKTFKPELLNRFDGIIVFTPLSQTEIQQVALIHIQKLQHTLLEKGMKVSFTSAVLKDIGQKSYSEKLGARPLRRYIQDHVESFIAKLILSKKLTRGSRVTIDIRDGKLFLV